MALKGINVGRTSAEHVPAVLPLEVSLVADVRIPGLLQSLIAEMATANQKL